MENLKKNSSKTLLKMAGRGMHPPHSPPGSGPANLDPLHCILLRMRDRAMSARVAIKRASYYRNEWQKTRKASVFRITTAKFLLLSKCVIEHKYHLKPKVLAA